MNLQPPTTDPSAILAALRLLCQEGSIYEMRVPRKGATVAGYFRYPDHAEAMAQEAARLNAERSVYITINPIDPKAVTVSTFTRMSPVSEATKDRQIARRVWLPIDCDVIAAHEENRSATAEELVLAMTRTAAIAKWLIGCGVPRDSILQANSGNGGHLLVRIELPNDDDAKDLMRRCLRAVHEKHSATGVNCDTGIYNAGRIWKLYGTVSHKGGHSDLHPHRLAHLTKNSPTVVKICPVTALHTVAGYASPLPPPPPKTSPPAGVEQTFDIDAVAPYWFPFNSGWRSWDGKEKMQLHRCPFEAEHSDAVIMRYPSGALSFSCLHTSCLDKKWEDVREAFDPKYGQRRRGIAPPTSSPSRMPSASAPVAHAGALAPALDRMEEQMADEIDDSNVLQFAPKGGEPPSENDTETIDFNEIWAGRTFASAHRDRARWCEDFNRWLVFDGTRWHRDDTKAIRAWVQEFADALSVQASSPYNKEFIAFADKLHGTTKLNNTLTEAQPHMSVVPADLDAHATLFNCINGTIDLDSQAFLPHDPAQLLSRVSPTPYDPDAQCPLWEATLLHWMGGDHARVAYLQRLFGLALSALTTEQVYHIFYGEGSNGKSLCLQVIEAVLGDDYYATAAYSVFDQNDKGQRTFLLEKLIGARLVVASEFPEGTRLKESLVKTLTGGDTMQVEQKNQQPYKARYVGKTILVTNELPNIRGTDHGIRRRTREVRWDAKYLKPEDDGYEQAAEEYRADPRLLDKLKAEASGILAWMVRGFQMWRVNPRGLDAPASIVESTRRYLADQDVIAQWIEDCCVQRDSVFERARALFDSYTDWANENGKATFTAKSFAVALKRKGAVDGKRQGNRGYFGIALRNDDEQYVAQDALAPENEDF